MVSFLSDRRRDDGVPDIPAGLPILSRGRHRRPTKGACFMEYASLLAGERWSDSPACTHPLLAALARGVNDVIGDDARQQLVPMVPRVVGLRGDDPQVTVAIALWAGERALPYVCEERQRALAAGLLAGEQVRACLAGEEPGTLRPQTVAALGQVPLAADWAAHFVARRPPRVRWFVRLGTLNMVGTAVLGLAESATPDPDAHLRDLLTGAIEVTESHLRPARTAPVSPASEHP